MERRRPPFRKAAWLVESPAPSPKATVCRRRSPQLRANAHPAKSKNCESSNWLAGALYIRGLTALASLAGNRETPAPRNRELPARQPPRRSVQIESGPAAVQPAEELAGRPPAGCELPRWTVICASDPWSGSVRSMAAPPLEYQPDSAGP